MSEFRNDCSVAQRIFSEVANESRDRVRLVPALPVVGNESSRANLPIGCHGGQFVFSAVAIR